MDLQFALGTILDAWDVTLGLAFYFLMCGVWLSMGIIKHKYEKLRLLKPQLPFNLNRKKTHIQLLCNYLLGITTSVQLSP